MYFSFLRFTEKKSLSSSKPDFIEHPAGVSLEDGDQATIAAKISGTTLLMSI